MLWPIIFLNQFLQFKIYKLLPSRKIGIFSKIDLLSLSLWSPHTDFNHTLIYITKVFVTVRVFKLAVHRLPQMRRAWNTSWKVRICTIFRKVRTIHTSHLIRIPFVAIPTYFNSTSSLSVQNMITFTRSRSCFDCIALFVHFSRRYIVMATMGLCIRYICPLKRFFGPPDTTT